jgi:hypothetical protein
MKDKIKIDLETGLMIDVVHPLEVGEDIIETPCLIPYCLPKWNGQEWVEGATEFPIAQEVIEVKPIEERIEEVESEVVSLKEIMGVFYD